MIPHERSLVDKLKDKPFALIGVNSDGTNEEDGLKTWREKAKEMGVTWRSFRDEGNTPRISESWRVQGWPTLYYIDHEGVIQAGPGQHHVGPLGRRRGGVQRLGGGDRGQGQREHDERHPELAHCAPPPISSR